MEPNKMEHLFRSYVDAINDLRQSSDLESIVKRHSIALERDYPTYQYVNDALSKKLTEKASEDLSFSKNNLHKLRRQLLLKHFVEDKPLYPYFDVLETLNAYIQNGSKMKPFDDEEWKEIIQIAIDLSNVNGHKWAENPQFYVREYNEGNSARYLQEKGFKLNVNNCQIDLDEKEYFRLAEEIENRVVCLGGYNVAEYIFGLIKPKFNKHQQRYNVIRQRQHVLPDKPNPTPQIPYSYLLNLCVKHFARYNHKNIVNYETKLNELLKLTISFISVLGIQDYSIYADMFIENEDFVNYVYHNILFDSIIGIKQFNPLYISNLIAGMLSPFFEEEYIKNDFKLEIIQLAQIVDFILNKESEKQTFITVAAQEIQKKFPKIQKKTIDNILHLFCHKGHINTGYNHPLSIHDFGKKPLIRRKKEEYFLIDRTWCAISFYDAICDQLRKLIGKSFDEKLGYQLEKYIKDLLSEKGINYNSGFYDDNEECDLIIETDTKIIFMEIKKKPLTRKASVGDGVKLFQDITKSLLSSQIQLGKHELKLVSDKEIVLRKFRDKKKSKSYPEDIISYKNRMIERISVNAWDYGFLNHRIVTQNVLQFLTYLELHATEPHNNTELNELRKSKNILLKQYEALKLAKKHEDLRSTYFDCLFLSLQQLIMILNDSQSKDEFINNLFINKYLTMSTNDFYFEYYQMRKGSMG